MKHSYILILQNKEKNYKLWNIFDIENHKSIYEVDNFKTGNPLFKGTLEECKKYIKEKFEDDVLE